MRLETRLRIQVGAIVFLFLAAIVTLLVSSGSLVAREGRRARARVVLEQAGRGLEARGAPILERAPKWPEDPQTAGWMALDQALGDEAIDVLRAFDGVEGGYYLNEFQRFLGNAFPTAPPPPDATGTPAHRSRTSGPPPREAVLIENQVNAAMAADQPLFLVKSVPPSTVALRTAPVKVRGQIVGATWTMTRLVDPLFLDRSIRGYQLAAGLALCGIVLALTLSISLVRTVRRQIVERERLRAELQRSERLAALGKLIAGVAHEIRNPLAGIRSTVQLWQRGIGLDAQSMADIVAESDRMEAIVARLLAFSRTSVQKLAPGDLNEVIAEAARLAQGQALAQSVQIQVDLAVDLPAVLMFAPALLQVIRNLTTNALEAMPRGGVLRLSTCFDPRQRAVLADVADTGPGLSDEVMAHLFEPFFTTRPGGTGLGMAIAREIIIAHRGQLQAVSRPGQIGATFRIILPVADAEEGAFLDEPSEGNSHGPW